MKINIIMFIDLITSLIFLTSSVYAEGLKSHNTRRDEMDNHVPEDVYIGELIKYPGPWAFQIPQTGIILVTDQELIDLANDPDKVLNLATGFQPYERSLRQICEDSRKMGARTLMIAFDHFFQQYRPGTDSPRTLTPDMDEYVRLIAKIYRFASDYGLKLELSLLSPLEIGPAYSKATGETGRWLHYRKGLRDPQTGTFSVELWQQRRWVNNKGPIDIEPESIRVFTFHEEKVGGTPYRVVRPESMVEISEVAKSEIYEGLHGGYVSKRMRIFGEGRTDIGNFDRVLVVQSYKCPEMDYFSDSAFPYLKNLIDKYIDADIKLSAFYSDEMHIQQDWAYFDHHDHGQFALRYVSKGLEKKFAGLYGDQYSDLAKYMIYFTYGQEDFAHNLSANENIMHTFGPTPKEIHETALFRSRYYELLQNGVVDLFLDARRYAEKRFGYLVHTRAHATWAESPTIDNWKAYNVNGNSRKYEYTSDFVWSNTVHQASSACHDYFKWGEFLTGTGNDHPEGGWLDRDYYALALACSTGVLNEIPHSYCAHWGHPSEVNWRRHQLQNVYGVVGGINIFTLVEDMQHRDIDVLMLYPLDLVSAEERFGSWTTQYGYANMITQAKLLEMGKVKDGYIEIAGRKFTTLATNFEPFPTPQLLDMMNELAESGGKVIWSGPPPIIDRNGNNIIEKWQRLFGAEYRINSGGWGLAVPGHEVKFENKLKNVSSQIILTDFIVDHIFPVTPINNSKVIARCGKYIVGVCQSTSNDGIIAYLGYRPRDDQSASLGYETRNWFEVLQAIGAYSGDDNTEIISRTTEYLACRFPNGTIAIAPHLTKLEEAWSGGFARNQEEDEAVTKQLDLPSKEIILKSFKINGHTVDYKGIGAMAFRLNDKGDLIAFAGQGCSSITIDGRRFEFSESPVGQIGWAPVTESRIIENGARFIFFSSAKGNFTIPVLYNDMTFYAEGDRLGKKGQPISFRREDNNMILNITDASVSRWVYGVLSDCQ